MPTLRVGDAVPPFELPDQDGASVRLADLLSHGPLVLYFYPKDDTPGCTAEACAFRDQFASFADVGATVVGVSSDPPASHRAFKEKHRLPFALLSDEGGALRKQLGVPKTLGLLDGRVTFVIGRDGRVAHVFSSQLFAQKHVQESLRVIERLKSA